MPERAVSPHECALVVAMPLTRAAFFEAASSARGDLVSGLVRRCGGNVEYAWAKVYVPQVVVVAERVIARARELGATVATHATLADWKEIASRYRVLTLLAHFRTVPILPEDVLDAGRGWTVIRQSRTVVTR